MLTKIITLILLTYTHSLAATITGVSITGHKAAEIETTELIRSQKIYESRHHTYKKKTFNPLKKQRPNRRNNPQNSVSPCISHYSKNNVQRPHHVARTPHIAKTFTAVTFSEADAIPPDSMGAAGPTQYIAFTNGRIKSFDKKTCTPDGVLDIHPNVFFSSVANGVRTADPRIRYDRFSQRWFLTIINATFKNNRVLIAVSSNKTITENTRWRYFFIEAGEGTFFDYATLGIDKHALYIGGDTFCVTDTCKVFVVQKKSLLSGENIHYTSFSNLANRSPKAGIYVPQGVDNFDSNPTHGYFIGTDRGQLGTLVLHRVNNPASSHPTLSKRMTLTVPTTQFPIKVAHAGNRTGAEGKLDGLDERLMGAHIRNNQLWTVQAVGVTNIGVCPADKAQATRNGCRWYQLSLSSPIPELMQCGTLFHATARNTEQARSYWMPSIMTNSLGNIVIGCSCAGPDQHINSAIAQAEHPDNLAPVTLTSESTSTYNPTRDPGSSRRGRRWGDYSYTCIDPEDDITMWSIQEFCSSTNTWGARVSKIQAPPPSGPYIVTPSVLSRSKGSKTIIITGNGFSREVNITMSNNTRVTNVTYINENKLRVTCSTKKAKRGTCSITITNPDGQEGRARNILTVR